MARDLAMSGNHGGGLSAQGAVGWRPVPSRGERWEYLDQLRAGLMLLGIPYHVALVYASHAPWIINSPDESQLLTWAVQFSHTFRMPAFFLLAGFFAMLMIQKRGASPWWTSRLYRLGIPMLSTALLINPLLMLAKSVAEVGAGAAFTDWYAQLLSFGEHWLVHLWFLLYLLAYSAGLAWLWQHREALRLERAADAFQDFVERGPLQAGFVLLMAGLVTVAAAAAAKLLGINYAFGIVIPGDLVSYVPAFLLGALLAHRRRWLEGFTTPQPLVWIIAPLVALVAAALTPLEGAAAKALAYLLSPAAGILVAHLLLSAARRWMNSSSRFVRNMVEASMTMYLVHIVFVCWLCLAFLFVRINPLLEFTLVTAVTLLASFATHLLVRRSTTLMLLFNGRSDSDPLRKPAGPLPPSALQS